MSVPTRILKPLRHGLLSLQRGQIRHLSLHEYQSQTLLKEYNLKVAPGILARSPSEVRRAVEYLGSSCVLKSQILGGGRGKGTFESGLQGGIQVVHNASTGEAISKKMLGQVLNTKQTADQGLRVEELYVVESVKYDQEWYLAMTIDRESCTPTIILSKTGGVDIEQIARKHPEKMLSFRFSVSEGITSKLLGQITEKLEVAGCEAMHLERILCGLYKLFVEKDATLLEINPLVRLRDGSFLCLDAKFSFDSAARQRQKDIFALQDRRNDNAEELEAEKYGLVYVKLDGNVGNVVNGAGLAMATNDAITHFGGASANFLDAGGKATKETMQKAFEIILRDDRVKVILVNIYGGITKCDMIAESIIGAYSEMGPLHLPVVVRLQGTNSEAGLRLLKEANLGLYIESDFGEAARKAVELQSNVSGSK